MSTLTIEPRRVTGNPFRRIFAALAALVDSIRIGHAMACRYERLSYMSDAQLAARGLRREDIVQAAMRLSAPRG